MRRLQTSCAVIIALLLQLGLVSDYADAASQRFAKRNVIGFLHATVIPMDRERILNDQTVIVENGKIVAVGPTSRVKVPASALRVDATGRYLIPALCDMHVHMLGEAWNIMLRPEVRAAHKDIPFEDFFFPFLANGVTLIQSMSATPEEILRRVGDPSSRPLLADAVDRAERLRRIRDLLAARATVYGSATHTIDTTGLTADQVVERVRTALEAR